MAGLKLIIILIMTESITSESVKVAKNINIASYLTNVPGLAMWIAVLARILISKVNLWGLVLICCLMIIF